MVFNLFGFKKKPFVEDAVVKEKTSVLTGQAVAEATTKAATEPATEAKTISQEQVAKSESTESVKVALPAGQPDQLEVTREDVIAAYKIFLGRMPESDKVLDTWIGVKPQAVLVDFLKSAEFLGNVQKSQLILVLAKKILDERKQTSATAVAAPSEQTLAHAALERKIS